jgi:hypothetical protein
MRKGRNREREANKFSLLPEGANHDVVMFSPCAPGTRCQSERSSIVRTIPVPPQLFIGRELDMYRILKALFVQKSRLLRITGPKGIGKTSVAKALANYVEKRKMWGDTVWLPPTRNGSGPDDLACQWNALFALIESPAIAELESNTSYNSVSRRILDQFYERKPWLSLTERLYQKPGSTISAHL